MKWTRLVLGVLALLAAGWSKGQDVFQAKDKAVVAARAATLADIVAGPLPAELRMALSLQVVAPALRVAETRELSRRQLQMAWRAALGAAADGWILQSPERITVTRGGGEPAGDHLEQAARQALRQRLSPLCPRLALQPRDGGIRVELPAQRMRLAARVPDRPRLASRMVVWLDVFEDEQLYRSWPIWFDVACFRTGFKAKEAIAKGDSLTAANVEEVELDAAVNGYPLQSVAGRMAARALPSNSLLQERDAAPVPLVKRGARVVARVRSGAVMLELSAIAIGDGAAGEVVYAKPEKGGAAFQARVAEDGALDVM